MQLRGKGWLLRKKLKIKVHEEKKVKTVENKKDIILHTINRVRRLKNASS